MFGIHHFNGIINPPQCTILAVGGGHNYLGKFKLLVEHRICKIGNRDIHFNVNPDCYFKNKRWIFMKLDVNGREETKVQATLSYDARVITAVGAAKVLAHLKHELENPSETSMSFIISRVG